MMTAAGADFFWGWLTNSVDKRGGGGQGPVDKRLTRGGVGGQNPQNMVDVISGRSLTCVSDSPCPISSASQYGRVGVF